MTIYKLTIYREYNSRTNFSSDFYNITVKELFFSTKEAAEKVAKSKIQAATELLGPYHGITTSIVEVRVDDKD